MKDVLLYLVQHIALESDKVHVEEKESDGQVELLVTCATDDIGRIIGKKGKVIKALRRVVGILALKEDKRVIITMVTPPSEDDLSSSDSEAIEGEDHVSQ